MKTIIQFSTTPKAKGISMLPLLGELLKDKTVFVLGAGASKDYGFPMWDDLKPSLIECFKAKEFRDEWCSKIEKAEDGCEWWLEQLTNMPTHRVTIDRIAHRGPDPSYDLFRIATARVLCECESKDTGTG